MTGRLLTDDSLLTDLADIKSHPGDSSQFLLGLMAIAGRCQASRESGNADELQGIICKEVLRSLLSTLHIRDVATVRHSRQVAMLSVGVAEYLGWEGKHLKMLEVASLLHDIGKIGVPDNILFKPGKLSPDEADLMAFHRNIAIDILQACRVDHNILDIVEQSYGIFNGTAGRFEKFVNEMHQGARILAVTDAYDSLRSEKAYRKGMSHDEILEVLQKESGTRFDGNIVSSLARWAEKDGRAIIQHAGGNMDFPDLQKTIHPAEVIEASTLGRIFSYLYLLESLYDGFMLIDADLRFVVWNYTISRLLGQPYSEMLGRTWTSRLLRMFDENGNALRESDFPLAQVIETKEATNTILQIQRSDNRRVKVEMHTVPLLDAEYRLHGVAATFRDLSRSSRRPREFYELKLAASRDSLTSVANRGELETQLALLLSEFTGKEEAKPFSLIFLDVDFFKNLNDSYGHAAGDQVLVDLARLLKHETYSGELVGRYGGEEFVILCPETELDQAFKRAERLRKAIPKACLGGSSDYHVTASFGVTQVEPGDSLESILRRADKALYTAKENGRNQSFARTSEDVQNSTPDPNLENESPENPFQFQSSFFACIAAEMVIYKLGGFVNDQNAKLLEVEKQKARIRLGKHRFYWPFWGDTPGTQPVELNIEFGNEQTLPQTTGRPASLQVEVLCEVQPLGRIRKQEIFEKRAKQAIKMLKAYFAAN